MQEVIILDFDEIQSAQDILEAFDNNYGIFLGDDDVAFLILIQFARPVEMLNIWKPGRRHV